MSGLHAGYPHIQHSNIDRFSWQGCVDWLKKNSDQSKTSDKSTTFSDKSIPYFSTYQYLSVGVLESCVDLSDFIMTSWDVCLWL